MLRPLALLVGAFLTALSNAVPEGPLESLSVDDVQELLKDWNLHNAFGEAFVADEVDGKTMLYLHVDDLQKEQHYPNARNFHARRLIAERDALAKGSKENVDVSSGGVVRRGLKESSGASSGVAIRSNSSCLSMGTTLDVSLCRDGDSSLLCNSSFGVSDTLDVAGDASFASELYFVGSNGGSVALSDLHGDVAALGDSLSDLAAASATNAADIIVNAADIAGNAALASTNAANITANNADIAVNMAEIAALRAKTDIAPTKLDQAKKEAFCSRINCCNENSEFVDDDTLHCWSDQYASFEEDPCSCTVKFVEEVDKSWSWHERFGHSLCAVNPAGRQCFAANRVFVSDAHFCSCGCRYCIDVLGGQLFSVHSAAAAAAIASHGTASSSIFIGLHDYHAEDDWRYSDGTPANWLGWNTGEPNDSNGEDCAEIYPSVSALNDIDCDYVYETRYASACTIMEPQKHSINLAMDEVLQEARCRYANLHVSASQRPFRLTVCSCMLCQAALTAAMKSTSG